MNWTEVRYTRNMQTGQREVVLETLPAKDALIVAYFKEFGTLWAGRYISPKQAFSHWFGIDALPGDTSG